MTLLGGAGCLWARSGLRPGLAQAWLPGRNGTVYRGELGVGDLAVVAYEDAREEGLVEQASLKGRARQVGRVRRPGLGEGAIEGLFDVLGVQFGGLEQVAGLLLLAFEALLLGGEHLVGDEPSVRELHESGLVFLKFLDLALVALDVLDDDLAALVGVALHVGPDSFAHALRDVNASIVVRDGLLDLFCGVVSARAGAALSARAATDAAEVLVDAAVAAMLAVEQSSAADRAVERAAEVVLVLVRSISSDRASRQQRPHPIEGVGVQRLILRLLLSDENERLWPLEAVVHHVGNPIVALDALIALSDAGLVHRWSSYVIPTRAAMHFFWLYG